MNRLELLEVVWSALKEADMIGDLEDLYMDEARATSEENNTKPWLRWAEVSDAIEALREMDETEEVAA